MHDTKLLVDSEPEGAAMAAKGSIATRAGERATSRNNFWAIVGLCVVGLVCSLYVPTSYLQIEQNSALVVTEIGRAHV